MFGGSTMTRSHLYMWVLCQIAPSKHGYKVNTKVGKKLSDFYQNLRTNQRVKGKDALMRTLFKATRMLYFEFISELFG